MKISELLSSYDKETFSIGLRLLDEDFFEWVSNPYSTFKYDFEQVPRYTSKYLKELKLLVKSSEIFLPSPNEQTIYASIGYLSGRELYIGGNIFQVHKYILRVDLISIIESYENFRNAGK